MKRPPQSALQLNLSKIENEREIRNVRDATKKDHSKGRLTADLPDKSKANKGLNADKSEKQISTNNIVKAKEPERAYTAMEKQYP